jgi:3-hydroxyacyl-[acyl-carrier-protein] dehydratase
MLKDDFYSCSDIVTADGEYSCKIVFKGDHDIFKGHFPGNPVVPGVCTIAIVKELLQLQVGKPLMLRSTGNVKFLQLVTPDICPVIKINWKADGEGYVVKASLTRDEAALFKFDGNYVNG